ncbi:hypothetical protein GGR53DRAFT_29363 [Hypoxylon sp. FL1150]|nr:hypothetical protein GGR53DRAFT_29363 [Hypoxylon sp. FL1150]
MSQSLAMQPAKPLQHRDASGRLSRVVDPTREHFLRPKDGRLTPLAVQGIGDAVELSVSQRSDGRNWRYIGRQGSRIPFTMRFVCWMYSLYLNSKETEEGRPGDESRFMLILIWVPCCLLLAIMLLIPQNFEGEIRNGGYYDPVRYRDWGYAKAPRNRYEKQEEKDANRKEVDEAEDESRPFLHEDMGGDMEMGPVSHHTTTTNRSLTSGETYQNPSSYFSNEKLQSSEKLPEEMLPRHFGPRFLCFLKPDPSGSLWYETQRVSDVMKERGGHAGVDFVFVSYTRKQFSVYTEEELAMWDISEEERALRVQFSTRDRDMLIQHGIEAARAANKEAFWIDFECIRDLDEVARSTSHSDDVYRICDIVRVAHSMIIVVGPSVANQLAGGIPEVYSPSVMDRWLDEYGSRLWTLPEILLISSEERIKLHVAGIGAVEELAKRNVPARAVWRDADRVRQLIDHYESTIHLTPLELVSIALECLAWRQTDQFSSGDIAYALMGLLRRRPVVTKTDSDFEAFARLSLANVNESLLERLLCMQPVRRNDPWFEIKDAWGARLWDIEPRCQVAGVADDQTVTLDGTFGATIQWNRMDQVAFYKRPTVARTIAKIFVRTLPAWLIAGLAMTISAGSLQSALRGEDDISSEFESFGSRSSSSSNPVTTALLAVGLVFLIPAAIVLLFAPAMLWDLYRGKFWSTQALLIGIEGVPDNLGWVEKDLFGLDHGRLKWSVAGSTLSQHKTSKIGECEALPPNVSPPPGDFVADAEMESGEKERLFTLIDTYSLTATAFRAVRPPSALIVCGHEGGMQRAVLCSYDWQSNTFAREAVVRVKTTVLDRMSRVDRFRFALKRRSY